MSTLRDQYGPDGCAQTPPWEHAADITVAAGVASEGATGVEGSYDVTFTLFWVTDEMRERGVHPCAHEGEVTLVRRVETGTWRAWGPSPDAWLDGRTVALLYTWSESDRREALNAIEAACAAECPA
jgi:hypothetical protein